MPTIEELDKLLDDPTRKVESYDEFTYGERVRVVRDDEDAGFYEGEEGNVLIEKLGSAEYGSLRTGVFIVIEGRTDALEILDPETIEHVG